MGKEKSQELWASLDWAGWGSWLKLPRGARWLFAQLALHTPFECCSDSEGKEIAIAQWMLQFTIHTCCA